MAQLSDERALWSNLRELKEEVGWSDDDPDYLARKKQVKKAADKMFNESRKSVKATVTKVSDSPPAEEKPTTLTAKWGKAGTIRLRPPRDYPKALSTLATNLAKIPNHVMFAPGSGYPPLKQGRNGNSSGKNYYSKHPTTLETFQYRMTCNGEEECAPPTPHPATPPVTCLTLVCFAGSDDGKVSYKVFEDAKNPTLGVKSAAPEEEEEEEIDTDTDADDLEPLSTRGNCQTVMEEEPAPKTKSNQKSNQAPIKKKTPAARPTMKDAVQVEKDPVKKQLTPAQKKKALELSNEDSSGDEAGKEVEVLPKRQRGAAVKAGGKPPKK